MADKDTPPKLPEFQCRVFGDNPVPRCARPAAPTPTRIQEVATAASRQRQRVGLIAGRSGT